jgi:hypothetical protein
MAYRNEWKCYLCGKATRIACPLCGEGVCEAHTLKGQIELAAEARARLGDRLASRLGDSDTCTTCVKREFDLSMGPFVRIYTGHDAIEVEILVESLRDDGYNARALGTRDGALIGAAQHIFEQRIEVPEGQAKAAAELIHALLSGGDSRETKDGSERERPDEDAREDIELAAEDEVPEDLTDDEEEVDVSRKEGSDASAAPRKVRDRRSHALAAGVIVIFPGLGHAYARSSWSAIPIAMTAILGFFFSVELGSATFLGATLIGIYLADLIGAQIAVYRWNRGLSTSPSKQLLHGAILAVAVLVIAAVVHAQR